MKQYVELEIFIQLGLVKLIFILVITEPANIYLLTVKNRNNTTHLKVPASRDKGVNINIKNNDKETPFDDADDQSDVKGLLLKL